MQSVDGLPVAAVQKIQDEFSFLNGLSNSHFREHANVLLNCVIECATPTKILHEMKCNMSV